MQKGLSVHPHSLPVQYRVFPMLVGRNYGCCQFAHWIENIISRQNIRNLHTPSSVSQRVNHPPPSSCPILNHQQSNNNNNNQNWRLVCPEQEQPLEWFWFCTRYRSPHSCCEERNADFAPWISAALVRRVLRQSTRIRCPLAARWSNLHARKPVWRRCARLCRTSEFKFIPSLFLTCLTCWPPKTKTPVRMMSWLSRKLFLFLACPVQLIKRTYWLVHFPRDHSTTSTTRTLLEEEDDDDLFPLHPPSPSPFPPPSRRGLTFLATMKVPTIF